MIRIEELAKREAEKEKERVECIVASIEVLKKLKEKTELQEPRNMWVLNRIDLAIKKGERLLKGCTR